MSKATPEVNQRNIAAVVEYSKDTRAAMREIETKLEDAMRDNEQLRSQLNALTTQVQTLQVRMFSGGATSGS